MKLGLLFLPLVFGLSLMGVLGIGPRDAQALARHFRHRQAPVKVLWQGPEEGSDIADFAVDSSGCVRVISQGRLWMLEGRTLKGVEGSQGVLRLFPEAEPGRLWMAGSDHRVLVWSPEEGVRYVCSVYGTVRTVRVFQDFLYVGFEADQAGKGWVQRFRRVQRWLQSAGEALPIGMDRWSGFELSPDGTRILANQPDGRGVGLWDAESGKQLAVWPLERMARLLGFADAERIVFDQGPSFKGADQALAYPGNRILEARPGEAAPRPLFQGFAGILATDLVSSSGKLVFADMEGMLRQLDLRGVEPPRLISPKQAGIPWRLRLVGSEAWVLLKGEETRIEAY